MESLCDSCTKSWTDDCPKQKCWGNNYSEYKKGVDIAKPLELNMRICPHCKLKIHNDFIMCPRCGR